MIVITTSRDSTNRAMRGAPKWSELLLLLFEFKYADFLSGRPGLLRPLILTDDYRFTLAGNAVADSNGRPTAHARHEFIRKVGQPVLVQNSVHSKKSVQFAASASRRPRSPQTARLKVLAVAPAAVRPPCRTD